MSNYAPPFEIVPQTNRTILFAPINPIKDNLYKLLVDDVSETALAEIDKKLCVSSFEEFLEKFEPTLYRGIYENQDTKEIEVKYTLENETIFNPYPIKITNNDKIIEFIDNLIKTKRNTGQLNYQFEYEKVIELLTPKNEYQMLKKRFNDLEELIKKEKEAANKPNELKKIQSKKEKLLEKMKDYYFNPINFIEIAIEANKKVLEMAKTSEANNSTNRNLLEAVNLKIDANGDIIAEKVQNIVQNEAIEDNSNSKLLLAQTLEEDYNKALQSYNNALKENNIDNSHQNNFIKDTIVNIVKMQNKSVVLNKENIQNLKKLNNQYGTFLEKEKQSFFNGIKHILQIMIGVKIFFDQYSQNNPDTTYAPKLIISNCKLEDFSTNEGNDRLTKYLKMTNDRYNPEANKYAIWFAIVPSVEKLKDKNSDDYDDDEQNFLEFYNCDINQLSNVLATLSSFKIQTFFSFNDKNIVFENIEKPYYKDNIDKSIVYTKLYEYIKFMEKQKYAEYAIACLPNITILPCDKQLKICEHYTLDEGENQVNDNSQKQKKKDYLIYLPSIYLEASFIAAAIVAAYQSPMFLETRFKKSEVCSYLPGVRFDIEKYSEKVSTIIGVEIADNTEEFKTTVVNNNSYCFFFSSKPLARQGDHSTGKVIRVYKARSLKKSLSPNNNNFLEIYKTTTKTYVERLIKSAVDKMTYENVENIIGDIDNGYKFKYLKKINCVNTILQEDENIYIDDSNKIVLKLKDSPQDIEIDIELENK